LVVRFGLYKPNIFLAMLFSYFLLHELFVFYLIKLFFKIFELGCFLVCMNSGSINIYIKEVGIASKICLLKAAP